jgi:hypothetical protein
LKNSEEIKTFYDTKIAPELLIIEELRKALLKKYSYKKIIPIGIIALVVLIVVSILLKWKLSMYLHKDFNMIMVMSFFMVLGISYGAINFLRKRDFSPIQVVYAEQVIHKLVRYIFPASSYYFECGIQKEELGNASLFKRTPESFSSDLIEGEVKSKFFKMAHLDLFEMEAYKRGDKTHHRRISTFCGTYIIIQLSTPYMEPIYIRSRGRRGVYDGVVAKEIVGSSATKIITGKAIYEEMPSGNNEFDSSFSIEYKDQNDALKFEKSKVINVLLEFKTKTNLNCDLCIASNETHIAIDELYLKPISVDNSFVESNVTEKYLLDLHEVNCLMNKIVEIGSNI